MLNFLERVIIKIKLKNLKGKLNSCGANLKVFGFFVLENPKKVSIGDNVTINAQVYISGHDDINIGDYVSISAGAKILTAFLDVNELKNKSNRDIHLSKPVFIGAYSQIGAGAIILPGVTIGEFCIIGAGSVVTKDVVSYSVVAGNPARLLYRVENK